MRSFAAWAVVASAFLVSPGAFGQDASPPPPQTAPRWSAPVVAALPAGDESAQAPLPHRPDGPSAEVLASAPSNGVGALVTGGIFTGLGLSDLATSPLCKNDKFTPSFQSTCFDVAIGVGGGFTALGVILLLVGANQRSDYNAWKVKNGVAHFDLTPLPRGGAAGWRTSF